MLGIHYYCDDVTAANAAQEQAVMLDTDNSIPLVEDEFFPHVGLDAAHPPRDVTAPLNSG